MSALVVSPHLDDAVFSATTALLGGARVVTVFAGVPAADAPLGPFDAFTGATSSAARMRERHREDDAALGLLDALPTRRLGLLDHQYRDLPYRPAQVREALAPVIEGAGSLVLPAGIGLHPDHLLARDAGLALAAAAGLPVTLAADLPYAVTFGWPAAVTGRPDHPGVDTTGWLTAAFAATGLSPAAWTLRAMPLDVAAVAAKRAALACYATQLPVMDQLDLRVATRDAVIAHEVVWVPAD